MLTPVGKDIKRQTTYSLKIIPKSMVKQNRQIRKSRANKKRHTVSVLHKREIRLEDKGSCFVWTLELPKPIPDCNGQKEMYSLRLWKIEPSTHGCGACSLKEENSITSSLGQCCNYAMDNFKFLHADHKWAGDDHL